MNNIKLEQSTLYTKRCCNICTSDKDVKELRLGNNIIALCKECRKKLIEVLRESNTVKDINGQ